MNCHVFHRVGFIETLGTAKTYQMSSSWAENGKDSVPHKGRRIRQGVGGFSTRIRPNWDQNIIQSSTRESPTPEAPPVPVQQGTGGKTGPLIAFF